MGFSNKGVLIFVDDDTSATGPKDLLPVGD